jgi:hypothetical protein
MNTQKFAGHTPGPWEISTYPYNNVRTENDGICVFSGDYTTDANAALIAAAPSLLAEVERLQAVNAELLTAINNTLERGEILSDWMREFTGPMDGTVTMLTDWLECTTSIRSALAKAREVQP